MPVRVAVAGIGLLAYCGFLVWFGTLPLGAPVLAMDSAFALAAAGICAGFLYLTAIPGAPDTKTVLWVVLAIGLACRAILVFGEPVAEDDYQRYLLDGGRVAAGLSPYGITPDAILATVAGPERDVAARVAYSDLPTIYPPTAQAAFAAAHSIAPWSVMGWKTVLLALDGATALLLLACLRHLALPAGMILIYWWNPLLLRYGHGSLHMEPVLLICLAAMVLLAIRGRLRVALAALLAAVGAKLWPALLIPLLTRRAGAPTVALLIAGAAGAVAIVGSMLAWDSSVAAFARDWQRNDALFPLIVWVMDWAVTPLLPYFADPQALARATVAAGVSVLAVWAGWRGWDRPARFCGPALAVTAVLLLTAPAVYPWYALWMLPFLTLTPFWPLLLLSALLPLYELRFWYEAGNDPEHWKTVVTWVQTGPVLAAAGWAAIRAGWR